jgi:hypothetical protein
LRAKSHVHCGRDGARLIWLNWASRLLCGILGGGMVVVVSLPRLFTNGWTLKFWCCAKTWVA